MNRMMLTANFCLLVFVCTGAYYRIVACATAPPAGYNVRILDEFALIIWDRDTKLEHFIRVANFQTDAPEMGFLVPTPSVPELFEVNSDQIAQLLHSQTAPRTVTRYTTVEKFGLGPWPFQLTKDSSRNVGAAPRRSVEVIGQYDVAGYEATVLRADDPAALKDWLDEHDYATTDSIEDWLQVYTDQNWIITAFKLSKTGNATMMKNKAVRMSFQSDQPFYPYREPTQDNPASSPNHRLLRIFLLADQRYDGTIGTKQPWPAYTAWSDNVSGSLLTSLASAAGIEPDLPTRLTEYEDRSSPRPGFDELYFHPSADQSGVERPPNVHNVSTTVYVPGWSRVISTGLIVMPAMLITGLASWLFFRRRRRAKRANSTESKSK